MSASIISCLEHLARHSTDTHIEKSPHHKETFISNWGKFCWEKKSFNQQTDYFI